MGQRLFVGNIAYSASIEDLKNRFEMFGQVNDVKIMTDRETGQSRGFGFVTFSTEEEAKKAEALNGEDFMGRNLVVNEARDRPMAPRGSNGSHFNSSGGYSGGGYGGGHGNVFGQQRSAPTGDRRQGGYSNSGHGGGHGYGYGGGGGGGYGYGHGGPAPGKNAGRRNNRDRDRDRDVDRDDYLDSSSLSTVLFSGGKLLEREP